MSKFQILFERDFRILLVTPGRRMSAVVSCGPSRRRQANAGFRAGFTEAWRSQRVWISSQDVRRGLAPAAAGGPHSRSSSSPGLDQSTQHNTRGERGPRI